MSRRANHTPKHQPRALHSGRQPEARFSCAEEGDVGSGERQGKGAPKAGTHLTRGRPRRPRPAVTTPARPAPSGPRACALPTERSRPVPCWPASGGSRGRTACLGQRVGGGGERGGGGTRTQAQPGGGVGQGGVCQRGKAEVGREVLVRVRATYVCLWVCARRAANIGAVVPLPRPSPRRPPACPSPPAPARLFPAPT